MVHARPALARWQVYVGGINYASTEASLSDVFSRAGKVAHVQIGTDRETGRSRGFAFVTFASKDSVNEAVRMVRPCRSRGRAGQKSVAA